ncbi:hypothetical protein jhhlp_006903 [Lomentospora prolificans]|uniref:Zn(2)-C6 fungal-type domain-containing protein n=1 Tax=Lomentospora prolificans TaxID=41688 RepID=A0A2N3N328_9PEZI|nr:hypothetical protein jhhlp_006903 [Lomentospora prolificans]
MPSNLAPRRIQFSSCDACRRSRVACDASVSSSGGESSEPCTRCRSRHQPCTFKWLQDVKGGLSKRTQRRGRCRPASHSSSAAPSVQGGNSTDNPAETYSRQSSLAESGDTARQTIPAPVVAFSTPDITPPPNVQSPSSSPAVSQNTAGLSEVDYEWLQTLYRRGFEAVFGSWMGRHCCPFLFEQELLAHKYVSISDLCRHLDQAMAESAINDRNLADRGTHRQEDWKDQKSEASLRGAIAAFSARWLPISSPRTTEGFNFLAVTQGLWRQARRDMLRVIHRPSYRSMLSLFLFALTPIPSGISEDEEADGISGQACVHAALQQIQTLRARQRNLKFSGSKVSPLNVTPTMCAAPDSIGTTGFINAESTAYWAALTFDTSASLTLDCRPLLSSGLFGFEFEMPWRLVRTCSKVFRETSEHWRRENAEMTDDRANQIIASGASWKLLGWKLTAIFKEAVRDGHNESEVHRAFVAVVDSIREFNIIYRPQLEECHKRLQFLGQETKLRWFSLMLHYHLSILMLIDVIEAADRQDLHADIVEVINDAETTVMNTLAYGLHTTMVLKRDPDMDGLLGGATITVPIVSIDPYPHHVVAGVQLMRKAIDRDFGFGKIAQETYQSLLGTLERTLSHLPQCSKSVQAARAEFSTMGDNICDQV